MNTTLLSLTAQSLLGHSPLIATSSLCVNHAAVRFSFAPLFFSTGFTVASFKDSRFSLFLSTAVTVTYREHYDYPDRSALCFDCCIFSAISSMSYAGAFSLINMDATLVVRHCSFVRCAAHDYIYVHQSNGLRSGGAFVAYIKSGSITQSSFYACRSGFRGACFTVECLQPNTVACNCTTLVNPAEVKSTQEEMMVVDIGNYIVHAVNFSNTCSDLYTVHSLFPGYTPTWEFKYLLFDGFNSVSGACHLSCITGVARYFSIINGSSTNALLWLHKGAYEFYNFYVFNTSYKVFEDLIDPTMITITFVDCVSDKECPGFTLLPDATIEYRTNQCATEVFTTWHASSDIPFIACLLLPMLNS